MRLSLVLSFTLFVASIFAEPVAIGTKSEILSSKGLIEDLVQSGTGAEELLSLAKESTKGAERYWLYANAFILQAKEGNFEEATETVKELRSSVTGIPDVELESLIELNAEKGLAEVSELSSILRETKMRIAAQKLAIQLKLKVRKNPKVDGLKVSLAEALAVSGEWDTALKMFSETKDGVATIAKAELGEKVSAKDAAFWWDYKPCRALSATTAFRAHAVEMYAVLLKNDDLSALEKTLAVKRIEQFRATLSGIETTYASLEYEPSVSKTTHESKTVSLIPTAEHGGVECRYTFMSPSGAWISGSYDDSKWEKGKTAYGTYPGNATCWRTGDVWIRYVFDCKYDGRTIESAVLRYIVDNHAEVWLNEKLILFHRGYITQYRDFQAKEIVDSMKRRKNILAVHAHDKEGGRMASFGQQIDFGLTLKLK